MSAMQPTDKQACESPLHGHVTVQASAGSGKTYLLVSRLVRLLLQEINPGSILAITFTRKAAAEMQQRLVERLKTLALCAEQDLDSALQELQLDAEPALRQRARGLYEQLLRAPTRVRATTFHAFCQDLLRRFPLEAEVPPGFELLERSGALLDAAHEALMSEAAAAPDSAEATALRRLFDLLGMHNTRAALKGFIHQRSDWWAFTHGQGDALAFAQTQLQHQFAVDPAHDPLAAFLDDARRREQLQTYLSLLQRQTGKKLGEQARQLEQGLAVLPDYARAHALLRVALLTKTGTPRIIKPSQRMDKELGAAQAQIFLDLHEELCAQLQTLDEALLTLHNLQLNLAWYRAGQALLTHYQRLKHELRLLDFTDLEWQTYLLLNDSDNALWVQYKLDQRIEHLLIDEFQDTNPTQWQLLLPLLEELAQNPQRPRSVFLVGDAKQSIYRFRRAEPRLFDAASDWLQQHLGARRCPLNVSWRSAPAVIRFVNRVFGSGVLQQRLGEFPEHDTHQRNLWGEVWLLPPGRESAAAADQPAPDELRNPLQQPRAEHIAQRYRQEAAALVERIQALFAQHTLIGPDHAARPLRYSDILILVRNRTHLPHYEHALRQAQLPYLSGDRGTLLDSLEVQDMQNLLRWLSMPFDNLALAGILRSPVFTVSDQELMLLARGNPRNWFDKLLQVTADLPTDAPLCRARDLLQSWRELSGKLPVHDLLDRIYSEGHVLARYRAAFADPLAPRVQANLIRFLELALEMDSGRYPSLMSFDAWLSELAEADSEAPDEPASMGQQDRIRILTIHGAKGLEAPVVFLVDSATGAPGDKAYQALVDWPLQQARPRSILLRPAKPDKAAFTRQLDEAARLAAQREEANLLYVALTRARQLLFISGSLGSNSGEENWYQLLLGQYALGIDDVCEARCLESSNPPPGQATLSTPAPPPQPEIDPRLSQPLQVTDPWLEIAPSASVQLQQAEGGISDEDGRSRGIVIHQFLEWLCRQPGLDYAEAQARLALRISSIDARACWQEAQTVFRHPELTAIFQPGVAVRDYNELPLLYQSEGRIIHGVIDRLLLDTHSVHIIDYKTHAHAAAHNLAQIAAAYHSQMQYYADGARCLWPERRISASLLFTRCATLWPVEV